MSRVFAIRVRHPMRLIDPALNSYGPGGAEGRRRKQTAPPAGTLYPKRESVGVV